MVGQNRNEYRGDETCYIVIYYGILCNISILCWNRICISYDVLVSDIGMRIRVFTNGPGDLGSISGRVIPNTQKMVLDASLLSTQRYKVRIRGKVEQSRERSNSIPYTLM